MLIYFIKYWRWLRKNYHLIRDDHFLKEEIETNSNLPYKVLGMVKTKLSSNHG